MGKLFLSTFLAVLNPIGAKSMNQGFIEEVKGREIEKPKLALGAFGRLLSKSSILPILILLWIVFAPYSRKSWWICGFK